MTPELVVLCGSVRFADQLLSEHRRLSLEGHVVLLPALPVDGEVLSAEYVEVLRQLHLRKVDLADRVHVVNVDGYVGSSTSAEIAHAEAQGKRVTYLVPGGAQSSDPRA